MISWNCGITLQFNDSRWQSSHRGRHFVDTLATVSNDFGKILPIGLFIERACFSEKYSGVGVIKGVFRTKYEKRGEGKMEKKNLWGQNKISFLAENTHFYKNMTFFKEKFIRQRRGQEPPVKNGILFLIPLSEL